VNTDLEIYRERVKQAQARIDADKRAGREPSKLDLSRLELNLGLVAAHAKSLTASLL
jgi:hypothetical protein